jgi:putative phosphoesterase
LIDKGAENEAVVDLIRHQAILTVQGNHDAKAQFNWFTYDAVLQQASLDYLSSLPPSLTCEWEGVRVHLCHSNPWEDSSIYIYPERPKILFQEIARAVEAEIIIMGHTHHPMVVQVDGKLLINPGSISGNRNRTERTCGVLDLPYGKFQLYDIDNGRQLAV